MRVSRERWQALEPLLDQALELEGHERELFLRDACNGDVTLRHDLDAMIAACEQGATMFNAPAVEQFAPLVSATVDETPETIGRYRVIRKLGRGGMATVYLANDGRHNRQVAVKVLHPPVALLVGASRFQREIEIAARLSHPNILPLHDSVELTAADLRGVANSIPPEDKMNYNILPSGGTPSAPSLAPLYYVTPFIAGESLRDRLSRSGALALSDAVQLAREVADALDYAHRQGVIHCDIKPENILLHEGHAVVSDFGIARAVAGVEGAGSGGMTHSASSRETPQCTDTVKSVNSVPVTPSLAFGTPAYMSPEQAAGNVTLDGRSDVYSLGCVLREMLGEGAVRSQALTRIVARATAFDRTDRYATAGDMARALQLASAAPRTRRVAIAGAVLVAVAAIALVMFKAQTTSPALSEHLVAVAPFDVADSSLALWREGLVDVLSRNLNGAGSLTVVPPSVVVRGWGGPADVATARELGRRTGASLVLFGGLIASDDSVRVTLDIFDTQSGRSLGSLERRDVPERMDRLTDSLTLTILRELGRARRIETSRANFSPTKSLVALKSFLQGEQFYRRAEWDSAQRHFEHATRADTSFALAYHRLAGISDLRAPEEFGNPETTDLLLKASRFKRGQSSGDSLLLHIDSLRAAADIALRERVRTRDATVHEATVRELLATLARAVREHPRDAELSLMYALSRSGHEQWTAIGEIDDRSMLASYDAAIRLDSSFAPTYIIPVDLAAYLDGAAGARKYLTGYLATRPTSPRAVTMQLANALLSPNASDRPNIDSLIPRLSAETLCEIGALLQRVADSAETSVRMFRGAMAAQARSGSPAVCAPFGAAYAYLFRGHLREAATLVPEQEHWLRTLTTVDLTRFGMIPPDSTRMIFTRMFAQAPNRMAIEAFRWWAAERDTAHINAYIHHYEQKAQEKSSGTTFALMQRASALTGKAFRALALGDTASAIQQLQAIPDSMQVCGSLRREVLAQLLLARGRFEEAAVLLTRKWAGSSRCGSPLQDIVWTMYRARAFDQLGRRNEALASYSLVRDAWRGGDPELQPMVREAERGIARLGGSSR